ncbi:MAG: hypothetical protein NTV86_20770 [Planctomycetota bacterium]|nr:hypothetical protein [Planctomycetota bacterium]
MFRVNPKREGIRPLWEKCTVMGFHLLYILIDTGFLAIWALFQAGANWLVGFASQRFSTLTIWTCLALEILFGIATIIPIILFMVVDIHAVWCTVFSDPPRDVPDGQDDAHDPI